MPTIFIHIGYNKTGTTAIQHFLSQNRNLLSMQGILYPEKCFIKKNEIAHHTLARTLLFEANKKQPDYINIDECIKDTEEVWGSLLDEINESSCTRVVISSEGFSRLRKTPALIQRIKDYLPEFEIKIICYIRRQDEMFESAYNQLIKAQRARVSVSKRLGTFIKNIDYYNEIKAWAGIFGKENLIIRIYSANTLKDGIIPDFLGIFGIDPAGFSWKLDSNPRLPNNLVPLKLFLNRIHFQKLMPNQNINKIMLLMKPPRQNNYSFLSMLDRQRILDHFEENNKLIGKEFLNGIYPFDKNTNTYSRVKGRYLPFDFVRFLITLKKHIKTL